MESSHIDNRKLYEAVNESAILEQPEVEHLSTCEECMETIRVLVGHTFSKAPSPSDVESSH